MNGNSYSVYAERTTVGGLSKLATVLADVIRGYKEMEDRADSELAPKVKSLLAIHERHAAEVFSLLDKIGGRPDDAGSVMGTVHEAVAIARDWFDALDEGAVDAIVDGEKQVIQQYRSTMESSDPDGAVHELIARQKAELEEILADLETSST